MNEIPDKLTIISIIIKMILIFVMVISPVEVYQLREMVESSFDWWYKNVYECRTVGTVCNIWYIVSPM